MRKWSGIKVNRPVGRRTFAWIAAICLSLSLLTAGCGQEAESAGNSGSAVSVQKPGDGVLGGEGKSEDRDPQGSGVSEGAENADGNTASNGAENPESGKASDGSSTGNADGKTSEGSRAGNADGKTSEGSSAGNADGKASDGSSAGNADGGVSEGSSAGNAGGSSASDSAGQQGSESSKGGSDSAGNQKSGTAPEAVNFEQIYDAAEAEMTGKVYLATQLSGYTGDGYLVGFESEGDSCSFQVEIPAAGSYDITVISAGIGGEKTNGITVDGETAGSFVTASEEFGEAVLQRVYLESGVHTIGIRTEWGWIGVDALKIKSAERLPESVFQVENALANPNATESAKGLMAYLQDIYGSYILSGQHSDKGVGGPEILALKKVNGDKTPAVLGLDFIEYTPSRVANGSSGISTKLAINFDAMGGINTFCWHWNAPEKYLTDSEPWYRGFYTEATKIDLAAIMNGEDEEGYELLLRDIDAIAEQIAILQEADVPILFRPLHEASGGWFWWGASGPESYIELWKLVFQRMTEYHKLNNIIWVWNGQDGDWYPGDEYVDIIGEDIYPGKQVYLSQSGKFSQAVGYTDSPRMIALTENGCLFDPDQAFRDQAPWLWFCTWSGEFVVKNNLPLLSEEYTEEAMVKKVYEDERVITLDELPDWKHYGRE